MEHVSEFAMVNEADNSFGLQQHYNEIEPLIKLLNKYAEDNKDVDSFIEIGSNKGGTFYILSSIIPGKKISIDYCDGNFGGVGHEASINRNNRLSAAFQDTHFIEGDSHQYSTVLKLKEILGNQKVSVLFIDGDHTFEGCYKDLIIYRQFVKQNGLIFFHDIKKTDYHTSVNCRVDLVWMEIKKFLWQADYYEFTQGDGADCSRAMQHATNIGWGGIGAVKNEMFYKRRNTHLFQVFHDQSSLDYCLRSSICMPLKYIPELVIHYEKDHFFENAIIQDVYKSYKFEPNHFIGITSPVITQKTNIPIKTIFDLAMKNTGDNAIVYSPSYDQFGLRNANIWDVNKTQRSNLYDGAVFLNNSSILPYDLFKMGWHQCYCNYWLARTDIFSEYVSKVLIPVMDFFKHDQRFKNYINPTNHSIIHKDKPYPIEVFIIEGLFGSFISNKAIKTQSYTRTDYERDIDKQYGMKSIGSRGTVRIVRQIKRT
jgi:hypothetical protein